MGKTAPSRMGLRNLLECQAVAVGPVSDSPSPTITTASSSGLSNAAPKAWETAYPSSPPSWIEPGVSGVQWLPMPPGAENSLKNERKPSASSDLLGKISEYVASRWPGVGAARRPRAIAVTKMGSRYYLLMRRV